MDGTTTMNQDLHTKLAAVVDALDPEFKSFGARDSLLLLNAGVRSERELIEVIEGKSKTTEVRASACWFAGRLRLEDAVWAMIAALKDEHMAVREAAAEALGQLGATDAVQPLLRAMNDTIDVAVRLASVYALGLIGDQQAIDPLISRVVDTNEQPRVRGMAAEKLGGFGDSRALDTLRAALVDPSTEVRFWAAFALGELGDARALGDLEHSAASDHVMHPGWRTVSEEAALAIESIKGREDRNPSEADLLNKY